MTALDLFSHAEARQRRDTGMAQAAAHSPAFSVLAYAALERVAKRQVVIHTDDLIAELRGLKPAHPNAFGAVWGKAIRERLIQRTTQTRASRDPGKHSHVYPIYFSLVFDNRGTVA